MQALYPVKSGDAAIFGHSLGGLFCLYSLFHRSDVFQWMMAASASIWWMGEAMLCDEQAYFSAHTDLPVRLFMSAGSKEGIMVSDMETFARRLRRRNYEKFSLETKLFEGEAHLSVVPFALSLGLRSIYA